jgi:hypothetical protein
LRVRRAVIPAVVFLACAGSLVGSWRLFAATEASRIEGARRIAQAPSELRAAMTVVHDRGPVEREEYRVEDLDGRSSAGYAVENRRGLRAEVATVPRRTHLVSFFYEELIADGVWELRSKPLRGNLHDEYDVTVSQLVAGERGSNRFSFTDPHYWATTGGHQFHLHLERGKPVPDLLHLSSTVLVEPRYERIVNDFERFGDEGFRRAERDARARVLAGK